MTVMFGVYLEPTVRPRADLYICKRTSNPDNKPCDEAFEAHLRYTDVENYDDPKKRPRHLGSDGDWYEIGINHRVENGTIRRDLGTKIVWVVQITDIQTFVGKYGPCVIELDADGFGVIEIYDEYRE